MTTSCRDTGGDALGHALDYAARGWAVFPIRPGTKRPACPDHPEKECTGTDPRCARAGRHVTWEERATTDPERITRAWTARPELGIGIATGPSGLLVIDLDVPKPGKPAPDLSGWGPGVTDGADVLVVLAERAGHPAPWETWTVATPTDGTHLYYALPPGQPAPSTVGTLGPFIDTRATGGYVLAPPSWTPEGTYRLTADDPPAPAPAWLLNHLTPARPAPCGPTPTTLTRTPENRAGWDAVDRYLNAALTRTLDHLTAAQEGERNRTLYAAACSLGRLAAGNPDRTDWAEAVERELTAAALHQGLGAHETARTLGSGLTAGAKSPRTIHPHGTGQALDTREAA